MVGPNYVPRISRDATEDISTELCGGGGAVLGIDLGTSNCCACIVIDGKPVVLDLDQPSGNGSHGSRIIPSIVLLCSKVTTPSCRAMNSETDTAAILRG